MTIFHQSDLPLIRPGAYKLFFTVACQTITIILRLDRILQEPCADDLMLEHFRHSAVILQVRHIERLSLSVTCGARELLAEHLYL